MTPTDTSEKGLESLIEVLTPVGLADILENYAQIVEEKNLKTGKKRAVQIFPRFHQLRQPPVPAKGPLSSPFQLLCSLGDSRLQPVGARWTCHDGLLWASRCGRCAQHPLIGSNGAASQLSGFPHTGCPPTQTSPSRGEVCFPAPWSLLDFHPCRLPRRGCRGRSARRGPSIAAGEG